jgi:hypothetical protein
MSNYTIQYPELVTVNAVEQAVQFADIDIIGHRVQVPIPVSTLNTHFRWTVPEGQQDPSGCIVDVAQFVGYLSQAFGQRYFDLDSEQEGLSFDTDTLNATHDTRLRELNAISINDVVMSFVLYKLYTKTATTTKDTIFNPEDAYGMLNNESLALAIGLSLFSTAGTQAIKTMFSQLVAKDPVRFQDASGNLPWSAEGGQTNGDWKLIPNDCVEIRVEFTFLSQVTRRDLEGQDITIPAGTKFRIRLQLLAVPDIQWTYNAKLAPLGLGGIQRSIADASETYDFTQTTTATGNMKFHCILPATTQQVCVGVATSDGTVVSSVEFNDAAQITGSNQTYAPNTSVTVEITAAEVKTFLFQTLLHTYTRPDSTPLHFTVGLRTPAAQITGLAVLKI